LPYANLKTQTLFYDIQKKKPELSLKEGIFVNDIDKYSIKVNRIDKKSGMMYGVLIYNHSTANRNYEVTIADSGIMEASPKGNYMEVELYNGATYTDEGAKTRNSKNFPFQRIYFSRQSFAIPLADNELKRSDEDMFKDSYRMKNIRQLEKDVDSLTTSLQRDKKREANRLLDNSYVRQRVRMKKKDSLLWRENAGMELRLDSLYATMDAGEQKDIVSKALQYARDAKHSQYMERQRFERQEEIIRRHDIEWHRKFTLSFACFIFFFIGAPLGGIIRKGGLGAPVVVSIFLFIVYYIIWMMGERAAREGALEPWQGMWISSVLLLPLGCILTYMSMTDSSVMSSEAYLNFIKKVVGYFKKEKHA